MRSMTVDDGKSVLLNRARVKPAHIRCVLLTNSRLPPKRGDLLSHGGKMIRVQNCVGTSGADGGFVQGSRDDLKCNCVLVVP